jgi:hypothetical protein
MEQLREPMPPSSLFIKQVEASPNPFQHDAYGLCSKAGLMLFHAHTTTPIWFI